MADIGVGHMSATSPPWRHDIDIDVLLLSAICPTLMSDGKTSLFGLSTLVILPSARTKEDLLNGWKYYKMSLKGRFFICKKKKI